MRVRIGGWQVARGEPDDWRDGATGAGDEHDWWFRAPVDAPVDGELVFEGLATLAEVLVDGEPVARSETMWLPVRAPLAAGTHEVRVVCRALAPRLAERRRPRARWRQQVAGDGNLRWFRTTLLGRAPGFAPGPPVVGLWRPAWFEAGEPRLATRARLDGDDGVLGMLSSAPGTLRVDDSTVALTAHGEAWAGEVRLPGVERWWPHTHGEPVLHEAVLEADGAVLATRRVGFRSLGAPSDLERDGLALRVNGVPVFARGALWTPVPEGEERATLERARDAGLNCVRLPGTGVYESTAFHDLCDELGMLVWQDLMFANLDYPFSDDAFRALVEAEVHELLRVVGGRPSLAVVCGNSEIEQQVAMLGLDPALGRGEFFGAELPALLRAADVDAVHVPSAPCGAGGRPLRADLGVSNYFGVGGYRRPLADARHAGVRFASECLALANVPDDAVARDRTAGVPRDAGADWDFADVRDHYLHLLYGVDPVRLAAADPERYQTLSRTVSGDVMAEVFGEWRRAGSPCGGGLVLWLRDLAPGAGWGLLDHRGEPKAVLGALRRVLSPVAIWMTDEGISGLAVHAANDGPAPLDATVRVALYRDGEHRTREASAPVTVPAHGTWTGDVEAVLGGWVDASYA
ncbi:MAG: glycoside hydrolase family 2 protein, partial [Solirubrobacteraceae bacterium]